MKIWLTKDKESAGGYIAISKSDKKPSISDEGSWAVAEPWDVVRDSMLSFFPEIKEGECIELEIIREKSK